MPGRDDVIRAEVVRGGVVESVHRGHAVVVEGSGEVVRSWGDPGQRILPRSALKPAQAAAMVASGLDLQGELLALAAASHSGEPFHREGAARILADAGVDPEFLATPPDLPYDPVEREAYLAAGGMRSRLAMNCSGKHAAMLRTACRNGWSLEGYVNPDHPLQERIRDTITALAGEEPWTTTVDGCGAPLFGVSLAGLARLGAALGTAELRSPEHQVVTAMRGHPTWVGGTRRDSSALMSGLPGTLAKEGAEGVYLVVLGDGRSIALKIEDGADRARPVMMAAILRSLGVEAPIVTQQGTSPIWGGEQVTGEIRGVC